MKISHYHAKYFAYELTKRVASDNLEKLSATLMDAQVDLNPHQIDAALFAFKSPLSKGAILADEVGLGKTIEAGILISQFWAERKRKILIILPSNLRKQWNAELIEKFFLPSTILETGTFNKFKKGGLKNPFNQDEIVLCSYNFARTKEKLISAVSWDLVVIDEAHRLRNVYKTTNKIATSIKNAINPYKKVLLTATPLQNSLLELYGLVSFIDDYKFGDFKSFKKQFSRITNDATYDDLKERLEPICKRTLRKQVVEYVPYRNRIPHTHKFEPSENEQALYDLVSEYLRRPNLQALPASQRHLMTLVLRKLLASSTYAIAGALESIKKRMIKKLKEYELISTFKNEEEDELDDITTDYESFNDTLEEWETEDGKTFTVADIEAVKKEISELGAFVELAVSIEENAKGENLLSALKIGFEMNRENGGTEKAVIFTESRRTQEYLLAKLKRNGFEKDIVLFNGSNNDESSKEIYKKWNEQYKGTDKVTGSKTADMRAAIVDHFRNQAKIMIATEAAAEGINLQFCSLVVNYDMPWNPQRIEQRIGRCHRYGQKNDVVVVNFLNTKNKAEERIYQLLDEKFKLFKGVFGASDEVLGTIESGVDFEKRILEIYQKCRKPEEIDAAFDALQLEMEESIDENMKSTRQKLLENFDEEVHEKLKFSKQKSEEFLDKYQKWLMNITKFALDERAEFDSDGVSFKLLDTKGLPGIRSGFYRIGNHVEDAHVYRVQHPLAQKIIEDLKQKELETGEIEFRYTGNPKISILEKYIGKSGILLAKALTVESFETEDHIIISAITDDGTVLDEEESKRLFSLEGNSSPIVGANPCVRPELSKLFSKQKKQILGDIEERNMTFFDDEMEKLDKWADDRRHTLKITLNEMEEEIKELKKQARTAGNMPEKLKLRKKAKELEKKKDEEWKSYENESRKIEEEKDQLIESIEKSIKQKIREEELFAIKWRMEG
ncbi:MAG TPA: SNF2-related protein [bacterium]|nr:SNF2-related protein [bacterium]